MNSEKVKLKRLLDVAAGREKADLVLKNGRIVDVYGGGLLEGDLAIVDAVIAGIGGNYAGLEEMDVKGAVISPGFIDSHIHIESSYVTPEEFGRLLIPHGSTTVIADPHEIVNVCGLKGLRYMLDAAEETVLDIRYMLPSCVPATPWEHAGAVIDAAAMASVIREEGIHGIGEFMNFPGVIHADEEVMNKLLLAYQTDKLIDGHSPGVDGKALNAYAAARIHTDHECSTREEMLDRISRGIYVLLRLGSACHDLPRLLPAVNEMNSRRCLLCSDDRQPKTILEEGHLEESLRLCVAGGLNPVTAIRMASLNAAECYRLYDRGAIAPGRRADLAILEDLKDFKVNATFVAGKLVAEKGRYLPEFRRIPIDEVAGSFHVRDFTSEKLKLRLKSDRVKLIDVLPGGVVTGKGEATVRRAPDGDFIYDATADIVKVAVVERHQNTGNVAVALLRGYGIREGAVALSIAHDSHNIIVVGANDADMAFAVNELIAQNGGAILCRNAVVLERLPMPVGGIMSDQSGEWVRDKLNALHRLAHEELGICQGVEPVMTLCFMSLAVIPSLKLTDMGLFDVETFSFVPIEWQ